MMLRNLFILNLSLSYLPRPHLNLSRDALTWFVSTCFLLALTAPAQSALPQTSPSTQTASSAAENDLAIDDAASAQMAADLMSEDAVELMPTLPENALPPINPFRAEFRARYNGKAIGYAVIELDQAQDEGEAGAAGPGQQFAMQYRMQATKGFASFVGANLRERGRFYWADDVIVPAEFHHRSKAFLSKTVWDAMFIAQERRVAGEYEGDDYAHEYVPGTLDPLTQFIFGAQQSLLQAERWQHWEVMKGELREYLFQRDEIAMLETECVSLPAWRVERRRQVSTATQEIWYSPELPWVPVKLRNVQKDGDELVLELLGLERSGRLYCGSIDRSRDDD